MAPLPENATARVWIDYTSAAISHTLMLRLGEGATPASAASVAADAAAILSQRMGSADSFTAARFAADGAIFSLPIAFTPVVGVISTANPASFWNEDPESVFIDFMGRGTATGRRVRWEFFTSVSSGEWPHTNRYNPGSSAPVGTLLENWTNLIQDAASTGEQIVTIGGDIPQVYGYVNIASNAYWQRKQR